jgi:ribosomal protein S18 acetylase RimI-like enzyme
MSSNRPIIRAYLPGDAAHIVRLHSLSEDAFEELDITEEFIDYIARRDDFRFFVASVEGSIVGFCGVLYYPAVGRAEIGPIAVDDAYRRIAIGRELYDSAEVYLKNRDVRRIISKVKASNVSAVSFFSSLGFVREGFFVGYTRRGEDVVQFVKFV